jgi:2,3-bisphosphoglycerate-dependent phosphoglycerate mutase
MRRKLILQRHGQSVWNKRNIFTGWVDIPLSEKGVQEAIEAGKKMAHIPIDVVFTSTLTRAQMTVALSMMHHKKIPVFLHEEKAFGEDGEDLVPVHMAWELNERMYGKLQGLNKDEMAKEFGAEQVQIWRRSYDVAPPEGESLEMTAARTLPYFQSKIVPLLEEGKNVLVSAHGNSLRSIVMHIEKISKEDIVKLEIPTGEPMVYSYNDGKWTRE